MSTHSNALAVAIQKHQAGQLQAAGEIYKQILSADPCQPDALYLFGVLAHDTGKDEIAVEFIRRAIQLRGNTAESSYNLGGALSNLKRYQEAIDCYRQALKLNPTFVEACFNLGNELRRVGELHEASACYCRVLELTPDFIDAHINLGLTLSSQGQHERAIASYLRAMTLKPDDAAAHSNLLLALQYCTGISLATLADAHAEFDRLHGTVSGVSSHFTTNQSLRRERLRLGFVSPDFGRHPVGFFTIPVFEHLEGEAFETFCYSDRRDKDEITQRFQTVATQWRDVWHLNDQELAEQIRADGVDILFDLAGHTANNRLAVFARRSAPMQVTWAGYTGTTGLRAMDYLLADQIHIPAGTEQHYREQILRMPDAYVCYDPACVRTSRIVAPGAGKSTHHIRLFQ